MRVGALANRTGLTVRTLRFYDEIGLLSPPRQPGSSYRQYGDQEISRLQQIVSLRQLGFSLAEIREILTRPETSVRHVIGLHLTQLDEQIALMEQLRARLTAIDRGLKGNRLVTAEAFLRTMEVMKRMDRYYTPEQLVALKARADELGASHIREVEAKWPTLIAQVQAAYDAGIDPADPQVQALAIRWMELVREFTGGDPGITQSVNRMWQEETDIQGTETASVRALMGYVSQAIEAGKKHR